MVVAMSCLVSAKWGGSLGLSLASVDIGGRGLLLTAGWEEKFSSLPRPRPPLIAPPWGGVRVLRCHSPCGLVAPERQEYPDSPLGLPDAALTGQGGAPCLCVWG